MGLLTIQDNRLAGMTLVPDEFIDYYMPRANGEFVKIYLYLLRSTHRENADPTLSSLADAFSCTEKDILRALRYWENAGLLKLKFHGREKELERITLLPIQPNLTATQNDPDLANPMDAVTEPEPAEKPDRKPAQISSARVKELKSDEDAKEILFFTAQYIGHPLSTTDMRRILYFYDELHFSVDLIDYLVEYCVLHDGRNMNYIEKVGLAWKEEGLTTVKAAKEYNNTWKKRYFDIFRAFGIRGRNPIPDEIKIMDKWLGTYNFPPELIKEAASRTVKQTGQPSFPYADRILSDWYDAHVQSLADVSKLDQAHQNRSAQSTSGKKPSGSGRTASADSSKFNSNFQQRDYDFAQLESELLKNQQ